MSKQNEIHWKTKSLIGACGGICLVVIRLIDANFFLDKEWPIPLVGYLSAVALVILSTIFTCFMDETSHRKLFMQALLAPSLLVAIVSTSKTSQPNGDYGASRVRTEAATASPTPTSDGSKTNSAQQALYAMDDRPVFTTLLSSPTIQIPTQLAFAQPQESNESLTVKQLTKRDLDHGSLLDGAKILLGRPQTVKTFIFMVVKTTDKSRAKELGRILKRCWQSEMNVQLLQPEGSQEIFLAIGEFDTSLKASKMGEEAKRLSRNGCDSDVQKLLKNGVIVDGRTLFK